MWKNVFVSFAYVYICIENLKMLRTGDGSCEELSFEVGMSGDVISGRNDKLQVWWQLCSNYTTVLVSTHTPA